YVRIGGPAEVFLIPQSREALMMAVRVALDHNIPYCFHGAGANNDKKNTKKKTHNRHLDMVYF
ncbi:MAG: hypothetical protein HQM16_19420, partial [Deltaproteobacteria bacterium]|nr:hypothetical protein [Deltaproteobacteria bacterium]